MPWPGPFGNPSQVVQFLVDCLNADVLPVIPCKDHWEPAAIGALARVYSSWVKVWPADWATRSFLPRRPLSNLASAP